MIRMSNWILILTVIFLLKSPFVFSQSRLKGYDGKTIEQRGETYLNNLAEPTAGLSKYIKEIQKSRIP